MYFVNRLFGTSEPTPASELMALEGGMLFLVRPDSIKGSRECIFIDASISIRRTAQPFVYELVVTRTYQEGEEQLIDEDAESSDERPFALDSALYLSLGPTLDPATPAPKPLSFAWLDPDGDTAEDEYEFVMVQGNVQAVDEFAKLVRHCLWEHDEEKEFPTERSLALVADRAALERYPLGRDEPEPLPRTALLLRAVAADSSDDEAPPARRSAPQAADSDDDDAANSDSGGDSEVEKLLARTTISDARATPTQARAGNAVASSSSSASKSPTQLVLPQQVRPSGLEEPLVAVQGHLYLFDAALQKFAPTEQNTHVVVSRYDTGYWLTVEGMGGFWVSQAIEEEMAMNFSLRERSMTFNFNVESETSAGQLNKYTWLVRFASDELLKEVQTAVTVAQYALKFGVGKWDKLKEDVRDYQRSANMMDTKMLDWDKEEEIEEEFQEASEEEEEEEDYEDEDGGDSEDDNSEIKSRSFKTAKATIRAQNSLLEVGYKDAMTFVVAGDMIGGFNQTPGEKKLSFVSTMKGLRTPGGQILKPSKVMLHNQDTSMILQDRSKKGSLFRLDLESGVVVEEYKVSDDVAVTSFVPGAKYAQTTQEQTFVGLSSNGLFRIDPRLRGDKLVDTEFKQYATNSKFSAAATTESGRLAVASEKGDIRLFDSIGKNAKTLIPELGDAIVGLDVSADGRWVLATCKTYLLLVDTRIPLGAGKYGGSSGFDRSFPADKKPTPTMLKLKPEHIEAMKAAGDISFTPAKFNQGVGVLENTIVTSTGPFVIAWNFRRVQMGDTDYSIRRFNDTVVADSFQYNSNREIVVTLPGDVLLRETSQLKAPSAQSLAPVKRSSGSGTVRTWDDSR